MPVRTREQDRPPFGLVALMFAGAAALNLAAGLLVHTVVESGFDGAAPFVRSSMRISLIDEEEGAAKDEEADAKDLERAPQIVDLDRVADETKPPDAQLASEFDNTTEHETRRPMAGAPGASKSTSGASGEGGVSQQAHPQGGVGAAPTAGGRPGPQAQPGQGQAQGDAQRNHTSGEPAQAQAGPPLKADDATGVAVPPTRPDAHEEMLLPRSSSQPPAAGSPQASSPASPATSSPNPASVAGSSSALAELFGVRPNYDPTTDQEVGAETQLNTERNRYASFYNRMREAVYQNWHPDRVMLELDPHGDKFPRAVRSTRLLVRLHPDGSVDRLRITQSSGVGDLDDEALRSVRAAAPFTNPPAGLVDPKSKRLRVDLGLTLHPSGEFTVIRSK